MSHVVSDCCVKPNEKPSCIVYDVLQAYSRNIVCPKATDQRGTLKAEGEQERNAVDRIRNSNRNVKGISPPVSNWFENYFSI